MEKTLKITIFFFTVFLLLCVLIPLAKVAADSECEPPYSGFGGCFPPSGVSCTCPATYPVCSFSQSLNQWCCYQSMKVGSPCTDDATGKSGTCNDQGSCFVAPSGTNGTDGTGNGVECPPGQICNPLKYDTFEEIVDAIIRFLLILAPSIAVVMFIIGGFMFVTSAGDPNRTGTAKKIILYTAIGLAIVLLASGLIKVIESVIGVK